MASCDFSIPCRCHGKICRLSYTSWYPNCEKELPRRRCRSECFDPPCRRKGKEMKNFSPKKYEKYQECENMDLDYDTKDFRLDNYRVRSNLCELPTTYIANNCQLAKVISDCQNDCSDSLEKSSIIYENSLKSFDISNQSLNFGIMSEKQDKDRKLIPKDAFKTFEKINHKIDHIRPHYPAKGGDAQKTQPPSKVPKTNTVVKSHYNDKLFHDFLNKTKELEDGKSLQHHQPLKNPRAVSNKLLESEEKNDHVLNKINLIESFKNPTEETKKVSMLKTNMNNNNQVTNDKVNREQSLKKLEHLNLHQTSLKQNISYQTLDFSNQKSLFEKQITRFEQLKDQLENQKSLLECQVDYFQRKSNVRPKSSPPWLSRSAGKLTTAKKPVKITKTTIGSIEMIVGGTSVSYDTSAYYDNIKDSPNLREKYQNEIDMLKERMHEIRTKAVVKPSPVKKDSKNNLEAAKKVESSRKTVFKKASNIVPKKKETNTPSKVSIKTKKFNSVSSVKLRKSIAKVVNNTGTASNSECSDSETFEPIIENAVSNTNSKETLTTTESSQSNTLSYDGKGDADTNCKWPLRESLFPNIPPYILFNSHDGEPFRLPAGKKYLKWKLTNITPVLVRNTLLNTGFRLLRSEFSRESTEWIGSWGKHMKSPMFKTMREDQKLNHFPGTFQVGRKDRLWRNLQRLMLLYGHKEFGFIPRTFILPQEIKLLKQTWKMEGENHKWIIKPPASARGTGIRVIHKWTQLPKKGNLIVQKYISNPFLINGSKFDLRLYVLVTSFDPLRIYLYPDGLVRFASVQYSDSTRNLRDRFMHLTNYSINKMSSNYEANDDANSFQGHKWTISKLWEYFHSQNIDAKNLWISLQELVIKTMLSGENCIVPLGRENIANRYNCYELFGVDVLLDDSLKPWLLEVNISPSLHSQSPLDAHVKGPMVQSLFNMAQFHVPPKALKVGDGVHCYNPKLYTTHLLKKERQKHLKYSSVKGRDEYIFNILDELTGDDVRHLTQAEDELQVIGNFERIFPTSATHKYLNFIESRYYNRLFDAWEYKYERNRKAGIKVLQHLCEAKLHLKTAMPPKTVQNSQSIKPSEVTTNPDSEPIADSPEPQELKPDMDLLHNHSMKQQPNALYNHALSPHYHFIPTKEGQREPPVAEDSFSSLKVSENNPCVATPIV